jgi:hypothetical protein
MKIVINREWGGFGLSKTGWKRYHELGGKKNQYVWNIKRNDPILVQVVEELGKKANGSYSDLKIVEIPDDVEWYIHDYDGMETVHEEHRSWN